MIKISENVPQFKAGVYDTINLFKTMFVNDRNIILSKNNVNYINNISLLLDMKTTNSMAYNFGVNFTLTQIKNFRENICINPILYLIALQTLLEKVTDLRELEKYNFRKLVDSLRWYYESSSLPRAIITLDCIKKLFTKECEDKFLNKVIDEVYAPKNVEIVESKENKIVEHKYYKVKGRLTSGSITGTNYKVFLTNHLGLELYGKIVALQIPTIIIYSTADFVPGDIPNITTIELPITTYIKHYNDLCILTGFGKGYQNLDIGELNSYSFGEVKDFTFLGGEFQFSSNNYLLANDTRLNNVKDKYSYYALQGKNLTIYTVEEKLETVRGLVSTIKALQNSGIFYTEPKTLRILIACHSVSDPSLANFVDNLLQNYLSLFKFNYTVIEEVMDNKDLQASFDVTRGVYDDTIFTSLDYYLNIFNLLDSNVKVLSKLA